MNYKARMYDPKTQRFLSPDPMNQYASPYTYVGNNPISLVDPSGMNGTAPDEFEGATGEINFIAPWWFNYDYFSGYSAANGGAPFRSVYGDATAIHMGDGFKTLGTTAEEEWDRNHPDFKILLYAGYTNESYRASKVSIHDGTGNLIAVDFDETKLVPYEVYLNLSMPGGALPGEGGVNLDDISNALGGFGFATAIGNEIANDYIRNQYKSAKSWSGWTKLKNNQQTWRTIRQLGNTGANVLKGLTVAGNITGVITTGYSGYKVTEQLISGGPSNVNLGDLADTVFGGAGVVSVYMLAAGASNPIGWAVLGAVAGVYGGVRTGMYIYDQFK